MAKKVRMKRKIRGANGEYEVTRAYTEAQARVKYKSGWVYVDQPSQPQPSAASQLVAQEPPSGGDSEPKAPKSSPKS